MNAKNMGPINIQKMAGDDFTNAVKAKIKELEENRTTRKPIWLKDWEDRARQKE